MNSEKFTPLSLLDKLNGLADHKARYDFLVEEKGMPQAYLVGINLDNPDESAQKALGHLTKVLNMDKQEMIKEFIDKINKGYEEDGHEKKNPRSQNREVGLLQQEALRKEQEADGLADNKTLRSDYDLGDPIEKQEDKFRFDPVDLRAEEPNWENLEERWFSDEDKGFDR
jgi:hypothetical protein